MDCIVFFLGVLAYPMSYSVTCDEIGKFGWKCRFTCNCADGAECEKAKGYCENGCAPGYYGTGCQFKNEYIYGKPEGRKYLGTVNMTTNGRPCLGWGSKQVQAITRYTKSNFPDQDVPGAYCRNPLDPQYHAYSSAPWCYTFNKEANSTVFGLCTQIKVKECPDFLFGDECEKECHCSNVSEVCSKTTGYCMQGCHAGYVGIGCDTPCTFNRYGIDCKQWCGKCQFDACDHESGRCLKGCKPGFHNAYCTQRADYVTVSNDVKVKPLEPGSQVDVTVNCTGSRPDLSFYIKNRIQWSFTNAAGRTVLLTESFYPASNEAEMFKIGSPERHYELRYEEINEGGGLVFRLTILSVTHADEGVYRCSMLNEANNVIDSKDVRLTVVNPVERLSLQLHSMGHSVLAQSSSHITEGDKMLQVTPGQYMVTCNASGSNPEPIMSFHYNDDKLYVSVDVKEKVEGDRVHYTGSFHMDSITLQASSAPQQLTCTANIQGSFFPNKVAGISLMVQAGVTHADNGVYRSSLLNKANNVTDLKDVNKTVVNPVKNLSLKLYSMTHSVLAQSSSPITEGDNMLEVKPGQYIVKCDASGSNPEPIMSFHYNDNRLYVTVDVNANPGGDSMQHTGSFYMDSISLQASCDPQELTCTANINGSLFPNKVAGISLMVQDVGKDEEQCTAPANNMIVIAVSVSAAVVVILVIVGVTLFRRRANKSEANESVYTSPNITQTETMLHDYESLDMVTDVPLQNDVM